MGRFMKRIIRSSIVAATTALISNIFNLSETKVGKILGIAIPMITFFTADDPKISDLIFKDSKKKRDKRKKKDGGFLTPKEAEDNFFNIFGDKGHTMSKFIAKETDSTEEEVNGVLGMTFSVMEAGFGRLIEEDEVDEKGF
ncbi:MAG: hypothetical protein ACK2UK_10880, partial [Candidatus Promineifilaceae bacterium]